MTGLATTLPSAMKRRPSPTCFLLPFICAVITTTRTVRASGIGRRHQYLAGRSCRLQIPLTALFDDDQCFEGPSFCRRAFVHLLLRGGARHEYDEYEDDSYDDGDGERYDLEDDDNEQMPRQRPKPSRPPPRSRPRPPSPSRREDFGSREQFQRQRGGRGPPPPYRPRPPPPRKKGAVDAAASLAKKTLDVSTGAAVAGLKGTGKAAFYLASPKHVDRREVWGIWRFDQQVEKMPDRPFQSCAANVEFTPKGDTITKYNDETYYTTYRFVERSWPRSCTIDFDARAFQGPDDDEPVVMYYKGYFRRKMADKSVVKIVGKIYEIQHGFWKGREGKKIQVGTFTARRRMAAPPLGGTDRANSDRIGEDEYDDELYDEYDYDSDINGDYDGDYDEE